MWIASHYGYFSIVKKEGEFYVRARKEGDLELLKEATGLTNKILKWKGTDYIARIIVNEEELKIVRDTLFDSITYSNFKDHIKHTPTQKDKVSYYSDIWFVMWEYQEGR